MPRSRRRSPAPLLSMDLWGQIVLHFFDNPRKVFMLLCAVKGLQLNDEWWEKLYHRHKAYNYARNYRPHVYLTYTPDRPELCKVVLKLVYGMFCTLCGCRFHHTLFEQYRMRICCECTRDNHMSNYVLWHTYGIGLEEIYEYRMFIRHLPLCYYKKPKQMLHLTRSPLDLEFERERKFIFFWKPDLERFFDFDERRAQHRGRILASDIIKAAIKRLWVQTIPPRYYVERIHNNEVVRIVCPINKHRVTAGMNWNLAYLTKKNGRSTPPAINLDLAFKGTQPMPILASNEYTLKNMGSKLNLKKDQIIAKAQELAAGKMICLIANKIFKN